MIEPLVWRNGRLSFLDQTQLPNAVATIETEDPSVVIGAIQQLAIRGAPLIGIAGAYAAVLSARRHVGRPWDLVGQQWEAIAKARPTAVNLAWAIGRLRAALQPSGLVTRNDVEELERLAVAIHDEDRIACDRIASHGVDLLPRDSEVLTHCNTGVLATGGIGTALGVIRKAWEAGRCRHVYVDETRPLLQGARLTAWELRELGLPFTIITDSTAAVVMQQKRAHAVIVGADRIAANGDTANKVGSYSLAVLAKAHGIPFYVAAPVTTIDRECLEGPSIPIEERHADEVREFHGHRVAPAGSQVYSPAFDVVPASLVTAIVTDRGVVQPVDAAGIARRLGT